MVNITSNTACKNTAARAAAHVIVMLMVATQALMSCKPSIPSEYLSKDDLADILYEYHIAEQLFNQQRGDSLTLVSYRANILKKHGVTDDEFQATMRYYTRHTKLLHDVYEALSDRIDKEIVAQGGSSSSLGAFTAGAAGSDTASIWNRDRCFVLAPFALSNTYGFDIEADSAFHKGDRIMLDCDIHFMYQEGMHDAMLMMSVQYSNDSINCQTTRMTSSSHYSMMVEDNGRLGIKRIRGFFYLTNDINNRLSTAMRFAVLTNIRMLRMHVKQAPATASTDSTANATVPQAQPTQQRPGAGTPASHTISNEEMEQTFKPVEEPRPGTGAKPSRLLIKPIRAVKDPMLNTKPEYKKTPKNKNKK